MITILPDCAMCGEPELWRKDVDGAVQVRCRECGWRSAPITEQDEDAREAAIHAMLNAVERAE